MPKMKTKRGAAKRFTVLKSGKVKVGSTKRRHLLAHKSTKMKRQARGASYIADVDLKGVKRCMPYGSP